MDIRRTESQRYFEEEEDAMDLELETKFDHFSKLKVVHKDLIESSMQ
jgi:hypothetical protein